MSIERIIWLVVGIVLLVWAALAFFWDDVNVDQKDMDAIQNTVLGVLALGLAARSR